MIAARAQIEIGNLGHPNLMQAQRLAEQAHNSILAAQRAHEWDKDGYAANAENLVEQAIGELREAMESSAPHR